MSKVSLKKTKKKHSWSGWIKKAFRMQKKKKKLHEEYSSPSSYMNLFLRALLPDSSSHSTVRSGFSLELLLCHQKGSYPPEHKQDTLSLQMGKALLGQNVSLVVAASLSFPRSGSRGTAEFVLAAWHAM